MMYSNSMLIFGLLLQSLSNTGVQGVAVGDTVWYDAALSKICETFEIPPRLTAAFPIVYFRIQR